MIAQNQYFADTSATPYNHARASGPVNLWNRYIAIRSHARIGDSLLKVLPAVLHRSASFIAMESAPFEMYTVAGSFSGKLVEIHETVFFDLRGEPFSKCIGTSATLVIAFFLQY